MTPARIRGRPFCIRAFFAARETRQRGSALPQKPAADAALFVLYTYTCSGGTHGRKDHQPGKRKNKICLPPCFQYSIPPHRGALSGRRAQAVPGALPRCRAGDPVLYRKCAGKVPGTCRFAGGALSGRGSCGGQAGRRGHPSGGVRGVPHPGAYLGGGAPRWAVSGTGAGAGSRQCGHFAAQRGRLWL